MFDLQIHSLAYLSLLASRSIAVITADQKRAQDFFTQTNLQHKKKKKMCVRWEFRKLHQSPKDPTKQDPSTVKQLARCVMLLLRLFL